MSIHGKRISESVLKSLIQIYQDDRESPEMLWDALKSFEDYHAAIYSMETKCMLYSAGSLLAEEYQAMVQEADKRRTTAHNAVIIAVSILNRMAEQNNLPPIYEGTVSRERPFRREIANSVLSYTETVIKGRR